MLKNIFILLFFAFFFVACSSDSGSSKDPSSSSGYTPPTEVSDPKVSFISGPNLEIDYKGNFDRVDISFNAAIRVEIEQQEGPTLTEQKFDSVLIRLDGVVLNSDKGIGYDGPYSFERQENVSGKPCGGQIEVCYEVYANGNTGPVEHGTGCDKVTREEIYCQVASSSSAEPSSSSIVAKPLVEATEDIWAYISYNSSDGELTAKSGTKLSESFINPGSDRENKCAQFTSAGSGDGNASVNNPTNTSQFVPCIGGNYDESEVAYTQYSYYLVRTPSASQDVWGSGWFLIRGESAFQAGSSSIDIKVWKPN